MQFSQNIESILKVDQDGYIVCSGKTIMSILKQNHKSQGLKIIGDIINSFGFRSAKAQSLKQVITSLDRFNGTDQRIYIKVSGNKVLGFVKVGQKNLFYRDYIGNIKQVTPTCILDIYVHQSCQRTGIGKQVFEKFLIAQKKSPQKLAYDRPSEKLISFLKKHYNLSKYIPQNNNYVIFDKYFENVKPKTCNEQKKRNRDIQYPEDSIQILKKQMDKLIMHPNMSKTNVIKNTINEDSTMKMGFNYPWAIKEDKINFRTTSNAYGSHYKYYK